MGTMEEIKSRAYLKQLFKAGKVPTDADFKKLIQSQLNSQDDLVGRRDDGNNGDSLCIGAGRNRALVSFFSSLNNAGSDWSLTLTTNGALTFKGSSASTPTLTLDQSGKVGIGTDQPATQLDVRGDVQAANLNLSGTATVNALAIPGLGTITDVDSLKRILGTPTQPQGKTAAPNTPTSNPNVPVIATPVTLTPATPTSLTPVQSGNSPSPSSLTPPLTPAGGTAAGSLAASKSWQQVAGPFKGFQALTVLAWVDGPDHRSICHATALCIDGDPYSKAIDHVQSYQGRPGAKIRFRWKGNRDAYYLECRTGMNLPDSPAINFKINYLL
jgi:hypothetical protein